MKKWERADSLTFFSIGRLSHKCAQRTLTLVYFILNAFWFEAEVQSLRRRRDDILDVGESTLDVGELTVGETTRRRNDRLPNHLISHSFFIAALSVFVESVIITIVPYQPLLLFNDR